MSSDQKSLRAANSKSRRWDAAVYIILAAAAAAVYWQTLGFGLTNYDDNLYVTDNPRVVSGINPSNVLWAFTAVDCANWHPLTWLSLMLDSSIGGLNPAVFHGTNVILHILNSCLLYLLLVRLTGSRVPGAFAAALFALHPMRVESVAWVAERKDVLSGLFWMLTILCYISYARKPGVFRYLTVVVLYALGLMSKPMLVTLPLVLLMLDAWSLRRIGAPGPGAVRFRALIGEKIPLFALALASSVAAVVAQRKGEALAGLALIPVGVRVANALVNYWGYIGKTFLPVGLIPIYPNPGDSLPAWMAPLSAAGLAAVTVAVVLSARKKPYLAVGWGWFIITLIPVIGLVQIGRQSIADRYTYLPHIGLFIMLVWGVADLCARGAAGKRTAAALCAAAGCLVLAVLGSLSYRQAQIWRDDLTLHSYTVKTAPLNPIGHFNLAHALIQSNRMDEAISHLRRAVELDPDYPEAHSNLGAALSTQGLHQEAVEHCLAAIRLRPGFADAYGNLGAALLGLNRLDEAEQAFREAISLDRENASFEYGLGVALARKGRHREAVGHFRNAVRISPRHLDAQNGLAVTLAMLKDYSGALKVISSAMRLYPDNPALIVNRANILFEMGRREAAVSELRKALARMPSSTIFRDALRSIESGGAR